MRWQRGYRSRDVEVRRGGGGLGGLGGGAGGLLMSLVGSRFGIVGILLVIGAIWLWNNFSGGGSTAESPTAQVTESAPADDPRVSFASFVFDDIQETWAKYFSSGGQNYQRARMVLFSGATQTGCGYGQSATGPFYCPRDGQVYLDLSFFEAMERQLGAKGDFAHAYVIAHEVGHHVQNLTGAIKQSRQNSVAVELQADCYAGVWAASTEERQLLEAGDIEEGLGAAAAVGDDRLQKKSQGTVQPETFTHGSSAQRMSWFKRGYESKDPEACDTFEPTASR